METLFVPCATPAHSLRFNYDAETGSSNWERMCDNHPIRVIEGIGRGNIQQSLRYGMVPLVKDGVYVFNVGTNTYVYSMATGLVCPCSWYGVVQCPGPDPYTFIGLRFVDKSMDIVTIDPVTMQDLETTQVELPLNGHVIQRIVRMKNNKYIASVTPHGGPITPFVWCRQGGWTSTEISCQSNPCVHASGFFRFVPPGLIEEYTQSSTNGVWRSLSSTEFYSAIPTHGDLAVIAVDGLTREVVLYNELLGDCYFLKRNGGVTHNSAFNPFVFQRDGRTMVLNTKGGIVHHCDGTTTGRFDDGVGGGNVVFSPCLKLGAWDYVWHTGGGFFVWSHQDGKTRAQIAIDHIDHALHVVQQIKRSVFIVTQGQEENKFDIAIIFGNRWLEAMESASFVFVHQLHSTVVPPPEHFQFAKICFWYRIYRRNGGHHYVINCNTKNKQLGEMVDVLLSLVNG